MYDAHNIIFVNKHILRHNFLCMRVQANGKIRRPGFVLWVTLWHSFKARYYALPRIIGCADMPRRADMSLLPLHHGRRRQVPFRSDQVGCRIILVSLCCMWSLLLYIRLFIVASVSYLFELFEYLVNVMQLLTISHPPFHYLPFVTHPSALLRFKTTIPSCHWICYTFKDAVRLSEIVCFRVVF